MSRDTLLPLWVPVSYASEVWGMTECGIRYRIKTQQIPPEFVWILGPRKQRLYAPYVDAPNMAATILRELRARTARPKLPPWIKVKDAAALMGVHERTILHHIQHGKIDPRKVRKFPQFYQVARSYVLNPVSLSAA